MRFILSLNKWMYYALVPVHTDVCTGTITPVNNTGIFYVLKHYKIKKNTFHIIPNIGQYVQQLVHTQHCLTTRANATTIKPLKTTNNTI